MALFKSNKKQQAPVVDPKPTVEAAKTALDLPSPDDASIRDKVKRDARKQKERKGVASTLLTGQITDDMPRASKSLIGGGGY